MIATLFAFVAAVSAAVYYPAEEPIPGSFIVVFKKGLSPEAISAHKAFAANNNVLIERHYSIGVDFNGYAGRMAKDAVSLLLESKEVAYVEEDGVMRASPEKIEENNECKTQTGTTWGLVRTSQTMLNIDGKYMYPTIADGTGVTVYVIDTGILTTHNEFNTGGVVRAKWGFNAVDKIDTDEHGHGTHCAGTIAGTTYGMAKGARLVAVKVLNKQGSGSTAGVIQGIDWTSSAAKSDASASVASMSLGGGKSTAMNSAIDAASGDPTQVVIFSVAAGNDNKDAINVSPASASLAICVAASDNTDKKATFSNWGRTVALYGPGVSITSSWIGSNTATNTISGTSMACPHVSGQIAKFMQLQPRAQPAEVKGFLSSVATDGIITGGATGGTPNKLLFADCDTFAGLANSTLLQKRY